MDFRLTSPNGSLALTVALASGRLAWHAEKDGVPLSAPAPLGLDTGSDIPLTLASPASYNDLCEPYTLPAFKKAHCENRANTMELALGHGEALWRVQARAYDDGVALRILAEGLSGPVMGEVSGFRIPEAARNLWAMKYLFSYEDQYHIIPPAELGQNRYAFPVLLELPDDVWALYTEAAVFGDYGGSNLMPEEGCPTLLRVARAPDDCEALATPDITTPWRVILAGSLHDITASNLLENLNPPSILEDEAFVHGGRAAWSWMSEKGAHLDPLRSRAYVDFAAQMGFEYYLADGNWQAHIDMPALVEYAAQRGVKVWVWAHSADMRDEQTAQDKLRQWSGWGVAGVKIDFFESDKPQRIAQYDMLARLCAKYRLMVNFHGCTKPAGEMRTYPHVLTREAVMGGEYFRNYSTCHPFGPDAMHNCTLPFTRGAIGPMDYTPVVYRTYPTGTSDAHQTALAVIFLSYVQNYGGSMDEILENPCRDFLAQIPAAWDEGHLLEGYPGSHVTMARRKRSTWFVAGICANRPRNSHIDLDFLEDSPYTVTICADDFSDMLSFDGPVGAKPREDAVACAALNGMRKRPEHHSHNLQRTRFETITAIRGDTLDIPMVAGGGFVAIFKCEAEGDLAHA